MNEKGLADAVTSEALAAGILDDSPPRPPPPASEPPTPAPFKPWAPPPKPWPDFHAWDWLAAIEDNDLALTMAAVYRREGRFDDEEFELACEYIADAPERRAQQAREAEIQAQREREEREAREDAAWRELDRLYHLLDSENLSPPERAATLLKVHELEKRQSA